MAGFGRAAPIANAFGLGRGASSLSARGPRLGAPKAPTFLGNVAAGHPNWFPAQHPSGGVGSAGSALLGLAGNLSQPQAQPAQPAAPVSQATGAGDQGSPLDSTYYNDVANYLFKTGNQVAGDQAKITNQDVALRTALGNLAYQQPRDALKLEQAANANGSLFSSVYGQRQGDLQHTFATRQTAAQTTHDQAVNALNTDVGQLLATEDPNSPTMNAFALASAQRAAAAAQSNPALGANPPAPAAPPAASSPASPSGGGRGRGRATGAGSALLNLAGKLSQGKKGRR